jgi:hypothetical protein
LTAASCLRSFSPTEKKAGERRRAGESTQKVDQEKRHIVIYDYAKLKDLAQQMGRKVTDLIALSRNHDPFYVGTPAHITNGKWFAEIWQRFGLTDGIHIRRMHYLIVSQKEPVLLPNGTNYENTQQCWDFLSDASEKARYLGLVEFSAFVDRRNPEAIIYPTFTAPEPKISVDDSGWILQSLPLFPDLPNYSIENYDGRRGYILELWCEKSTMNDVLEPISRRYRVNLQTGVGELSIIKTYELFERVRRTERPIRIGYLSDFDPGGQSMPVAVARKLEFFLRSNNGSSNHDVKLFPLCLTLEQTRRYELPRTPIKETEKRRDGFEQRFGEGATELDALEALHPGTLEQIVREWIGRYYDHWLESRVEEAKQILESELDDTRQAVIAKHGKEIERLRQEHHALRQEFDRKLKIHSKKLSGLLEKISADLQIQAPDVNSHPIPEALEADESVEALFDGTRDYFEQLRAYKEFQGRDLIDGDEEHAIDHDKF